MILREITIGRSADSDIYLDESYVYASNNHDWNQIDMFFSRG